MENDYTGGDICIDGSTDCIGNDIVHGSRTDIHLKKKPLRLEGLLLLTLSNPLTLDIAQASLALFSLNRGFLFRRTLLPLYCRWWF